MVVVVVLFVIIVVVVVSVVVVVVVVIVIGTPRCGDLVMVKCRVVVVVFFFQFSNFVINVTIMK